LDKPILSENMRKVLIIITTLIGICIWSSCAKEKYTNPSLPPDAPSNFLGHAISDKAIFLEWNDNSRTEEGFAIFRADTSEWQQIRLLSSNAFSYIDSPLQDTSFYSYYIIAFNDAGNSASSDTLSISTKSTGQAPNLPFNPSPPDSATNILITTNLTWQCGDPDNDTLKYDLYFGADNPPSLLDSNLLSNMYSPGSLFYLTNYFWKIVAKDNDYHIKEGPLWKFITTANNPPIEPFNPSPQFGDTIHESFVLLSWDCQDPENAPLKYDIFLGLDTTPSLIASDIETTSYLINQLGRGQNYYWKIIAKDNYNNFRESPLWKFRVLNSGLYFLGQCDTKDEAWDVFIQDHYAYVAADDSGLFIFNVSNPGDPLFMGKCLPRDKAHGVVVSGNYAYISDCFSGLQIVDVSDPYYPFMSGNYDTPGDAYDGIYYANGLVYLPDYSEGMQILDVSNPANPQLVGTYDGTNGLARDIYVDGTYAYLIYSGPGLVVLDVSNPAAPYRIGAYYTTYTTYSVCGLSNRLYIPNANAGLVIFDITIPRTPTRLGAYQPLHGPFGTCVSGNYVFVADGNQGLKVIDVSNPANPTLQAYYNPSHFVFSVKVAGNYVYLAAEAGGLYILEYLHE
jgi:hypothetical protein